MLSDNGACNISIGQFVEYYNHFQYHKSLDNVAPANVYLGR
jgi:transposase InsO family protein